MSMQTEFLCAVAPVPCDELTAESGTHSDRPGMIAAGQHRPCCPLPTSSADITEHSDITKNRYDTTGIKIITSLKLLCVKMNDHSQVGL